MKVVCINNYNSECACFYELMIDKIYEAVDHYDGFYIINDVGENWYYEKKYFKTLSEIRNYKINKLL